MVQWLAHLTCNPGNAGSIPTHGISVFHSKWISQYFVLARDYIVGFPVLHSKYIYRYIYIYIYIFIYELSCKNFNVTLTMAEDDV